MVKKTYSVTLDENLVLDAQVKAKFYGGKLSPIINSLLGKWLQNNMEEKEIKNKD